MKSNFTEQSRRLGLKISYYRKCRSLSQMQLADCIGVSRTHMSRIENNDCGVSLNVIFRIADALEIPVAKLFE
ncbi:MAG TPA: helix-turn-helix domain-containing protein [Firmicutes bacterium]|nr:helix-turn-helix domain-containing protein [Bacillota bacterium]